MEDPDFADRVSFAEHQFERALASVIVTAAVKLKSHRAALAFLERRFPDVWAQRLDLRVEQRLPEEEVEAAFTPEQRRARLREIVEEGQRRLAEAESS